MSLLVRNILATENQVPAILQRIELSETHSDDSQDVPPILPIGERFRTPKLDPKNVIDVLSNKGRKSVSANFYEKG